MPTLTRSVTLMLAHQCVDLKRDDRRSLAWPHHAGFPSAEAARRDTAVHVSLSSYSLVKQLTAQPRGPVPSHPGTGVKKAKPPKPAHPPWPQLMAG
jgi:hypothetical protein